MGKLLSLLILFFSIITATSSHAATMSERDEGTASRKQVFDKAMAESYDKRTRDGGIKESLFEAAKRVLTKDLPEESRVLCVGAGTGAEIISFARAFPKWTFTAVDPSSEMLDKAQEKMESLDITSRVTFHVGTLETLPADQKEFDLATSILVSHFLGGEAERTEFFRGMSNRLKPKGYLVTADLVSDVAGSRGLLPAWLSVLKESGFPYEELEAKGEALGGGKGIPFLPIDTLKTLITSAGFNEPLQFYQWLYIHGFVTQKAEGGGAAGGEEEGE